MSSGEATFVELWRLAIREAGKHELTAVEKAVAMDISFFMDWRTGQRAHPGSARLARETGLHVRTVQSALESLVAKGWLVVTQKGRLPKKGEKRVASKYAATYPTGHPRLRVEDSQSEGVEPVDDASTTSPESSDYESWLHRLRVQDSPISSNTSSFISTPDFSQNEFLDDIERLADGLRESA